MEEGAFVPGAGGNCRPFLKSSSSEQVTIDKAGKWNTHAGLRVKFCQMLVECPNFVLMTLINTSCKGKSTHGETLIPGTDSVHFSAECIGFRCPFALLNLSNKSE